MKKVVVVGAGVMDLILKASSLKVVRGHEVPGGVAICEMLGGKIESEEGVLVSGGGGTNVAVGLHRLGEAVRLVSRVGDEETGDFIVEQLHKESIDLRLLQRGKGKTGMSAVLVSGSGERSIVTYRGESGRIDPKQVDWDEVRKADWMQISSLGGEMGFLEDLVQFGIDNGIRIGINPGKKELDEKTRLMNVLKKVDFVSLNRMEASTLLGIDFDNEREILVKCADAGLRLVAVTDGKRGASLITNRRLIKMNAYPNESIDNTGAGDAFVSGMVSGLLLDRKIDDCLKMGLANGGSVVSKLGAKSGLLTRTEMEKWLSKKIRYSEEWV